MPGQLFTLSYIFQQKDKGDGKERTKQYPEEGVEKISPPEHFKIEEKSMMKQDDENRIQKKPFESVNKHRRVSACFISFPGGK